MADLVMPRLSDTMEEGTILRWLKSDGEEVARGEELVEIETDKATMVYESDLAGSLQIVAAEGETLGVGQVIAHVGEPLAKAARPAAGDEPASAAPAESAPADPRSRPADPADAPSPASSGNGPVPALSGDAPFPALAGKAPAPVSAGEAPAPVSAEAGAGTERPRASPLARRIARERGVDLQRIEGSGPGGRIVKVDVLSARGSDAPVPASGGEGAPAADAPAVVLEGVATAKGETSNVELTRTQQTIARRMAESKATIPDFWLQTDVDMEACVALRAELKRMTAPDPDAPARLGSPTYNDMVVKACALALREHPHANGSYRDGRLQLHSRINVGVAVAAEDALVVPTVFDADEKSLGEIARETRALAERVRAGTVTPPELGGGTFTVSNLGMYGVRSFGAIINPPQAAILSVGAVAARAVVHDGELASRHTMTLVLVCDHRILYGAAAAEFAARVRDLLQAPSALTL